MSRDPRDVLDIFTRAGWERGEMPAAPVDARQFLRFLPGTLEFDRESTSVVEHADNTFTWHLAFKFTPPGDPKAQS